MVESSQKFYGRGKLLLSGEYLVLDGVPALAVPASVGQTLSVQYRSSYSPRLIWEGLDREGNSWFNDEFELWHFRPLRTKDKKSELLTKVFDQIRSLNCHFLREEEEVRVTTKLEFPLEWGLGSSSTLLYTLAKWARVDAFDLQHRTLGGSGYDIACAGAQGPLTYSLNGQKPEWRAVEFSPAFHNNLYFVYTNFKANSLKGINDFFHSAKKYGPKEMDRLKSEISEITYAMLEVSGLEEFCNLLQRHEFLMAKFLERPQIQESFSDFPGQLKSLGAWGGDFILAASKENYQKTREYFEAKGHGVIIPFNEMVCSRRTQL